MAGAHGGAVAGPGDPLGPPLHADTRQAGPAGRGPGGLRGKQPPSDPRFQDSRPGLAALRHRTFCTFPQQLKGLLFPHGKNKRQRQLCVSSKARTTWKEKLPSQRSPLYLNGCSPQMWSHSLATGELGGLSCHVCGRGYITRTAHTLTHTNPETAPGQTSRAVSHRCPAARGLGRACVNQGVL